jgi:hypothetical protein
MLSVVLDSVIISFGLGNKLLRTGAFIRMKSFHLLSHNFRENNLTHKTRLSNLT